MRNIPILVIDTETTGTDTKTARILEFGAIGFPRGIDGESSKYLQLVNADTVIPEDATRVHGITAEDVRGLPRWRDVGTAITKLMVEYQRRGGLVVAYNGLGYDFPLLRNENLRGFVSNKDIDDTRFLDIILFYRWWFRFQGSCALKHAARACMVEPGPEHTALGDCVTTARLLRHGLEHGWITSDPALLLTQQTALLRLFIAETKTFGKYIGVDSQGKYRARVGRSIGVALDTEAGVEYIEWILRSDDASRRGENPYPPLHESLRTRLQRFHENKFPTTQEDMRLNQELWEAVDVVRAVFPDRYTP